MFTTTSNIKAYTPEQVAKMLQLSKNSVYKLIKRGEIIEKKLGKVYRIPPSSIFFVFTGLDSDLYLAEKNDKRNLPRIENELKKVRRLL